MTAPVTTNTTERGEAKGFVMVPRECTPEMLRAARRKAREMLGGALNAIAFEDCWDAAIAAAPPAQPQPGSSNADQRETIAAALFEHDKRLRDPDAAVTWARWLKHQERRPSQRAKAEIAAYRSRADAVILSLVTRGSNV